jgi:ABC-type glycerol-3-phosphate transport system substrate-binding protein
MRRRQIIVFCLIVAALLPVLVLSCSAKQAAGASKEAKAAAPAKLIVSGIVGNPGKDLAKHKELYEKAQPGSVVEWVTTDTNTREQVLKTAIASGDPPAVGYYWGTRLNSFYKNGMCLDIKSYFDQAFIDKIDKSMLQPCLGKNGEIFGLPFSTVYHTTFYNKDMMDKYGFKIPETWDDMTTIFKRLKQDGIFGFATNSASMQDCLYGITYGELETKVGAGTSWGVANGDVSVAPGSPAGEVIRSCIQQVKAWYDAGYWYPGKSGINTTADDANAAFAQGKVIFIFNFSGALSTHQNASKFKIGAFMKPTSKAGMKSYDNIEPSVYFIPSNASKDQIYGGVEFMKAALSQEAQQTVVGNNQIPSVLNINYINVSDTLKGIMEKLSSGNTIAGINPTRTSSEMQTFIKTQIFAAPLGGTMTVDQTLNEMERLRLAAKAAAK